MHRHTKAPLGHFEPATRRFDHIHIDIVGPLPPSQNCRYLFTVVDRFTRWPEAIPLVDAQTTTCATALSLHWIARFGVPTDITSDRGSQFTSELWSALTQLYGTRMHWTSAYHPQANGMVEIFHRHLKSALMARLTGPNWIDELPWVLLGIRTALTVPGDFLPRSQESHDAGRFLPRLRETVRGLTPRPPVPRGTRPSSVPATLATSEYVFIRRYFQRPPLTPPYEGPYKVLAHGDKSLTIDLGNQHDSVSIDRLKPAFLDPVRPVDAALRPPRGRPPAVVPTAVADRGPVSSHRTRSGRQFRPPESNSLVK